MRKYLQAEFYKLFHSKFAWAVLLAVPVLVICYLALMVYYNFRWREIYLVWSVYGVMESSLPLLSVGFVAAFLVSDLVFAGQYRRGTLKNEVAYGIPRFRTYLGKLLAQVITSVVLCVVVAALFLGLSWVLFPHEGTLGTSAVPENQLAVYYLQKFLYVLAVAFPLFLGVQGAACCLFFLFKHELLAAGVLVFLVEFLDNGILWLASLADPAGTGIAAAAHTFVDNWLPRGLLAHAQLGAEFAAWWDTGDPALALELIGQGWLTGMVWFVLFTAVGLLAFRRREIQ